MNRGRAFAVRFACWNASQRRAHTLFVLFEVVVLGFQLVPARAVRSGERDAGQSGEQQKGVPGHSLTDAGLTHPAVRLLEDFTARAV